MNIAELLEIYMTEGGKNEGIYCRGPTSLQQARQEIVWNNIHINPFDLYATVAYAIVSLRHPKQSPQWKFEKTKRILKSGLDTIASHDRTPIPEEPCSASKSDYWDITDDDLHELLAQFGL